MKQEYIRIASVNKDEKVVSTIQYGGGYYWNFKFPFRHYVEPRLLVATENAIYELVPTKTDKQ